MELMLNYLNLGNMAFDTLVLPASDEEIDLFWNRLNPMDSDCELQWVDSEFTNLVSNYNDLSLSELKELSELSDHEFENFDLVFYACDNFTEAMEIFANDNYIIYSDCRNDYDLGYEIAEQQGLISANDDSILARYFDYDSFGKDCRLEGNFTQVNSDTVIEIIW